MRSNQSPPTSDAGVMERAQKLADWIEEAPCQGECVHFRCQDAKFILAMANEIHAHRNRKPTRGPFCGAECLGMCEGCRSETALAGAMYVTDNLAKESHHAE